MTKVFSLIKSDEANLWTMIVAAEAAQAGRAAGQGKPGSCLAGAGTHFSLLSTFSRILHN